MEHKIPWIKTNRINKFCNEADDFGLEIIKKDAFPSMCKLDCSTKNLRKDCNYQEGIRRIIRFEFI